MYHVCHSPVICSTQTITLCEATYFIVNFITPITGAFHLYDSDHDGYVTREEMEAIVDSMHKMVGQMVEFSEDDETPQTRVDKLFDTMDSVS